MKPKKFFFFFIFALALVIPSCEPDKIMAVETGEASNILTTTADVSGVVIDVGEGATQHGHVYGITAGPLISGSKTSLGVAVTGDFTSSITGLQPETKYYVRAYTSMGSDAAYGSEINFTTASPLPPEVSTAEISGITKTSAVSGGSVTSSGGTAVTARGVYWSTTTGPTIDNNKTTDGSGLGTYTSNITGLSANTKYYIRAYATNAGGTAYGSELSFTTIPEVIVLPAVTTAAVTSVTTNSAISGGEVTNDGGGAVTAKGVCWSTSANPTIINSKTNEGAGSGSYVSSITGLIAGTSYYVRAYATNSAGTSYGEEFSFTTSPIVPTVTTVPATSITSTTASSGGDVTNAGGSSVIARGVCWSTLENPTVDDNHTSDGPGTGTYSSSITGLTGNTTYYIRAYATNSAGTGYGNELSFKTGPVIPTIATTEITAIAATTASGGGNIISDGGSPITAKGVCWSISANPTTADSKTNDGTGTGSFTSSITGLTPGTIYHVRAFATNSIGTAYGADIIFTAGAVLPVLATTAVTDITATSAKSGGNITSDGGSAVTARGVCWSTSENPTTADSKTSDGTGTGPFVSSITGLTSGTVYHVRAYATNPAGTAYGDDITFTAGSVAPIVSTTAISDITSTTASSGGDVTSDGGASVTAGGVCWSTTENPTVADSKTSDAAVTGTFTSSITGLIPCTLYHVRAYATNTAGTGYGDDITFTSGTSLATATTTAITNITSTTASSGGNITGSCAATVTERGLCWSTSANPTTADTKTSDGTGGGSYTTSITGLTNGILYHVRAYATNPAGTAYGEDITFTAGAISPTVTTAAISGITATTVSSGGEVTSDGGSSVTARGVCWSTSADPTTADSKTSDDSGTGTFTSSITGLTPCTTYHVRAYATNSIGTSYGEDISFTAGTVLPSVSTAPISAVALTTASSGGNITGDCSSAVTARGVCWSTSQEPTVAGSHSEDGSGAGSFASNITGLSSNTTYYARAYATNSAGTAYGEQYIIKTATGTVTDADGNSYYTVTIGTQVWMMQNLKTTKYNDGTGIPLITDNTAWSNLTTPGYCWYDNDETTYKNTFGALYNWYTTETGKLCPAGWHVPTNEELTVLETYLGGSSVAGGKLKEAGNEHWSEPNTGATNESGFSALPGSSRKSDGTFFYNDYGFWWTATENDATTALDFEVYHYVANLHRTNWNKGYGFSVRCIEGIALELPVLTTTAITGISSTAASSGGNITSDGGTSVTARGVCWSTSSNPTTADSKTSDGTGTGSFVSSLTGLTASTTYHVRAYATNSAGTAYGEDVQFTTSTTAPTVTTAAATGIGTTGAAFNGTVNANNSSATVTFEYGTSVSYGLNIAASPSPVTGIAPVDVTASVSGLTPGTDYHFRVKAVNAGGTAYGDDKTFKTASSTITDADGNVYNTITIGTQIWMAENLKTTKYRDGTSIPNITGTSEWLALNDGAYCDYGNTPANSTVYGRLYNWYTAINGHYLCPTGWHVPTHTEWGTLVSYLGGESVAGGKLKEAGVTHWNDPNTGATNEYGFTALPGGDRYTDGQFYDMGNYGYWWTSSYNDVYQRYFHYMSYDNSSALGGHYFLLNGLSVRCLQGEDQVLPLVSTTSISAITSATATSGGDVTSTGGSSVTARGVCWNTSPNPYTSDSKTTDGTGSGTFSSSLTGLTASTKYYVRAYATNSIGTAYGGEISFTTSAAAPETPTLTTTAITAVATTTALSGGNITSDGGASVTSRGVCWSTSQNPDFTDAHTDDGSGTGSFASSITGLSSNTTYYVRAYATNSAGTGYGEQFILKTATGTITDIDGNSYYTVTNGTQLWMMSNLKVTHYSNGDAIPQVTDGGTWTTLTSGAYCNYENNVSNVSTYGRLYNFYATVDNRRLCPSGWHVPNDEEWKDMEMSLGMTQASADNSGWRGTDEGGKMKEAGLTHWADPNSGANNESGITALPAGRRSYLGPFYEIGNSAYIWTSTESSAVNGWYRYLAYNLSTVNRGGTLIKNYGFSVRCIQGEGQFMPSVTTTAISGVTASAAVSGGDIASDGGASVSVRGVCWNTATKPTIANSKTEDGSGTGSFVSNLTGLSPNTTYYLRAYATNSIGTAYGNEISFTTDPSTVSDIDGNVYFVVRIGTQLWMKENLKTTHYNDGTEIPLAHNPTEWAEGTGLYCWYNNDEETYKGTYGALYAWGTLGAICPTGWHVPSASEWSTLADFLGGLSVAGGKMKETGTAHWVSPNTGATNESGFTARPGGQVPGNGTFEYVGTLGAWYTTTSHTYWCDTYFIWNTDAALFTAGTSGFADGYSVRCLRDY